MGQKSVQLRETATGKMIGQPLTHEAYVSGAVFSPDGATLLTRSGNTARLWETATGKSIGQPLTHDGPVLAAAFSSDGRTVATGSQDKNARLWAAATGQPIGRPLAHGHRVCAVALHPDGRTLLTGSGDGIAQLWDAATGEPIGQPLRHPSEVSVAAFSPDGRFVLTAGRGGIARAWHVATSRPIGPPLNHPGGSWTVIRTVAFSQDGRTFVTDSGNRPFNWRLSVPRDGEAERIVLWTQVLTGMELDAHDVARTLDPQMWCERGERLGRQNDASLRREEMLARHRLEADDRERQAQWFAAAFHLTRLLDLGPPDGSLHARRGHAYYGLAEWEKAAADYAKATELGEHTREVWSRRAWLCFARGDGGGYRKSCASLLQRFAKAETPGDAYSLARTCVLGPDAATDPKVVLQLARKAVEAAPKNSGYLIALGAAHYRAGEPDTAIERLNEALNLVGKGELPSAWLFLSMAHYRLGHADEATAWLDRAARWIDRASERHGKAGAGFTAEDRLLLEYRILHREAEALVRGAKP
jgi:tetratricopeptide (TPR) repeat protein